MYHQHLFCVMSMFASLKMLIHVYKKLRCFKKSYEFLCIYLGEGMGWGCCTNACICIGTHSQSLLQNRLMDFDETWMKYSMSLTCFKAFWPGGSRAVPKQVIWGPLLQKTSSSDWKATATNRMHSNNLEACGKKCCYFWFRSDIVILPYFNAISIDFFNAI